MLQYFDTLQDTSGNALVGATVTVTTYPAGAAASIYSTNGTASPLTGGIATSDSTGQVSFFIEDGSYILTYKNAGTTYKTRSPVQMTDPMNFVAATDTGSAANTYVVSNSAYPLSLYTGLKFEFLAAHTNTGASTLNLNSTGAQAVNQPGGSALVAGMIQSSGLVRVEWDGTQWELIGSQSQPFYAQTVAEAAVSITPSNTAYPTLNILRYGGDNTGTTDNVTAFNSLISVMKELGGAQATLPPGTYNLASTVAANLAPSSGTSVTSNGLAFSGYGVVIKYTGSAFAFDFSATNLSAYYYQPTMSWYGVNIELTSSAQGGWRQSDIGAARYYDCFVFNGTNGAGFTQRNQYNYSENNHYVGCGVVTCLTGIAFVFTTGAAASMARTTVHDFFGAGITDYWFDIGGGCSVYNSRFSHICGNFGSAALFGIGTSTSNAADMTGTVIDGIDTEDNGNPNSFYQSIIRLRDYPQTSGVARRPILYNVGAYATNGGVLPVWAYGTSLGSGTSISGPELSPTNETQGFTVQGPIASTWGQSTVYEANYNAAATRNVASTNSVLQSGIALTGYASPPSGRCLFERTGNLVIMSVYDSLIATSNSTAMTLTGIPSEFIPSGGRNAPCFVEDNGNNIIPALAAINNSGVITFYVATAFATYSATGFTASGSKGLNGNTTITWNL